MNRTLRTLAAVATSFVLATAVTACGSDDDDKKLSASEFKKQANDLCKEANADTEEYGKDISESSSDDDVAEAIDKTVDRNKELVEAIDDLEAPDSLEKDVESMLDSVEDGLDQMSEINSLQDLMTFDPSSGAFKDANEKATELGLPDCAS